MVSIFPRRRLSGWGLLFLGLTALMLSGRFMTVARADDGPVTTEVSHEFTYKPAADSTAKTINLAGEFNGWSTSDTPMIKQEDGSYRVIVKLAPGKHLYKFVLDGMKWINDPAADKSLEEDDGQQGKNSAVVIAEGDKPQATTLEHTFTFHPQGGSSPKTVNVAGDFNGWSTDATSMTAGADGAFTAKVKLKPGICHYKFVTDGSTWTPDPTADKSLDQEDGHGGMNSGVVVK